MANIFRSKSTAGKLVECAIGVGLLLLVASFFIDTQSASVPSGYEQILARGRIAAVTEPSHVSAEEAGVADDNPVLGVVIEGQPVAYSLNLLNHHEVVNDSIGSTHFAAVW